MTCLSKCLKEALRNSWSKETAHDSHDEAAGDKSPIGQCDVTALMIQETMGGEIIRCDIRNSHSRDAFVHYYNKNDGEIIDATAEGIDPKYIPNGKIIKRETLLLIKDTKKRYETFEQKVYTYLAAAIL